MTLTFTISPRRHTSQACQTRRAKSYPSRCAKQGQLATVKATKSSGSELTRYTYDADGNLLVRTSPQETVAYLGGTELRTTDGTTATATRYYTCGGAAVAMRTTAPDGGKVTYLMADTQASTQLAVDAKTGTTTRRRYTPFGDERSGSLPAGTDHGFLGNTEDTTTGLSLLGARAYDPKLGRFLSPDPISAPYDPQNLSAFSYSHNDPINYSDPSGLSEMCGAHGACYTGGTPGGLTPEQVEKEFPGGEPLIHDIGDGAPDGFPTPHDVKLFTGPAGNVSTLIKQAKGWGTYAAGLSDELNVELYLRERCSYSFVDGCAEFRKFYDGWKHVDAIPTLDTCPLCGNIGFGIVLSRITGGRGPGNCFLAGTEVLMADGSKKKIEKIKVGDKVLAADPETGKSKKRKVTALIVTDGDKDLNELTIATTDGNKKVTATRGHPFWVQSEHQWLDAGQIRPGMKLRTSDESTVEVRANHAYTKRVRTYNLTVADLHTYYVLAGSTPILVHNAICGPASTFSVPERPGIYTIHLNDGTKYVGMSTTNINSRVAASMGPKHAVGSRGYGPADVENVTFFTLPAGVKSRTARRIEQTAMEGLKSRGVTLLNRRDPEIDVPTGGYLP
ncbi:polymorphic toxin-type HINT domain-containing protein [Streptomyces sp. NBC_01718]|uniref:polymorphic toxin-type HINT domain-containing protein n=1 Tax=Streptomyces sp. NBC_01718 TaxID=2975919 RepID=UPI00352D1A74